VRTGIVLAGGRSTRFVTDKLAEPIDGDPLLERAIAAASAVTDEVIVAGRRIERASSSVRGIPDVEPFGGPLAALVGVLEVLDARRASAIVVGGDMPRLVPEVLCSMLDRLDADPSIDAVILARAGAEAQTPRQVLPMALRVRPGGAAGRIAVSNGRRSLQALLDILASSELPASVWQRLDPDGSTLLDVDTRADLDRIRAGKGR
jgi:molybdopterin-guanine dinucleotide biosynthesis protein A